MIPRLFHSFQGDAGTHNNVVPDFRDSEFAAAGVVLNPVVLDGNGYRIKGSSGSMNVFNCPIQPAGYTRHLIINCEINADLAQVDPVWSNRVGFYCNYGEFDANSMWGVTYQETGSSSAQTATFFYSPSTATILNATGNPLNGYFGSWGLRIEAILADDYVYGFFNAGAPSRAFHNCRSYEENRRSKHGNNHVVTMGWGTDNGWAKIRDLQIIDMPDFLSHGVSGEAPPEPPEITASDLAMATNPYAFYDFQQSWSTGLQDVSGNDRHLDIFGSGPYVGTAVRSTTTRTANWSFTSELGAARAGRYHFFRDLNGALLNDLFFDPDDPNRTRMTLTFSWREDTENSSDAMSKIIGWRDNDSARRLNVRTWWGGGTGHTLECRKTLNHTTNIADGNIGGWTRTSNWSIITLRYDGAIGQLKAFRNGVSIGTHTDATRNSIYSPANPATSPFEFPGNMSSDANLYGESDFLLMNREALSDTQIIDIHNAYMAELL